MDNHSNNGHADHNDHDNTEGNHQYYPKGWHLPLIGLVIIALGFTMLGTFIFSHSGTERWGKTEQCCEGEGACCKDGKEGDACKDKEHCKDAEAPKNKEGENNAAAGNAPKADTGAKPAENH